MFGFEGIQIEQVNLPVGRYKTGDFLFGRAVHFILVAAVEDHFIPDKGIVVEVETEIAATLHPGEFYHAMLRVFIDPFVRHGLSAGFHHGLCEEGLTHKQKHE